MLVRAAGLGLVTAGSYYFNFFLSLGDGGGVYISASYRRLDFLVATFVLWICATALWWLALQALHLMRPGLMHRLALASVCALLVSVFIRCISKMSGVGVTDQVLTIAGGTSDGLITKIALLVPSLAAFAAFCKFPCFARQVIRFVSIAGVVALPLGALRLMQTPLGRVDGVSAVVPARVPHMLPIPSGKLPAKRRVVWVIFDEFDPQVAFDGVLGSPPQLPHFENFQSRAVVFRRATSPAKSTIVSVPALLLGRPTGGNVYSGPGDLRLLSIDGARISMNSQASLFGRVEKDAGPVTILGFYIPYCEVFSVSRCYSFGTDMGTQWFDGLANFIPKTITGQPDSMSEITRTQFALLPSMLSDRSSSLVYLHLNVPHLHAHFASQHFGKKVGNALESYMLNLRLADEMLGNIIDEMVQSSVPAEPKQQQMLIVSSDHWYRGRPGGAYPALQIVKIDGDDNPLRIEQPVSAYHLSQLVQDFLAGHVSTHKEAAKWYVDKPFAPTWMPNEN